MIPKKKGHNAHLSLCQQTLCCFPFCSLKQLYWIERVYSHLSCSLCLTDLQPQRGWALFPPRGAVPAQERCWREEMLCLSGMSLTCLRGTAFPRWYFWATIAEQVCPLNALLHSGIYQSWQSGVALTDLKHPRKHCRKQLLIEVVFPPQDPPSFPCSWLSYTISSHLFQVCTSSLGQARQVFRFLWHLESRIIPASICLLIHKNTKKNLGTNKINNCSCIWTE